MTPNDFVIAGWSIGLPLFFAGILLNWRQSGNFWALPLDYSRSAFALCFGGLAVIAQGSYCRGYSIESATPHREPGELPLQDCLQQAKSHSQFRRATRPAYDDVQRLALRHLA
ncbi:hypothetical protein Pla144_23390 [Bythopirellula polymerisocia]|uniref:Uncharacterized protein n=1 Tax=Bythopirellula polymerisocia TaxID=2528003 RepID=A0A5C6CSR2_9BACT|nr:hypothetical protein Pla144_23390 [Bythopirellula polymerisocia]